MVGCFSRDHTFSSRSIPYRDIEQMSEMLHTRIKGRACNTVRADVTLLNVVKVCTVALAFVRMRPCCRIIRRDNTIIGTKDKPNRHWDLQTLT
jgi:hypothetical protein